MTGKATRRVVPAAGHVDGSHLHATIAERIFRRLDSFLGLDVLLNLLRTGTGRRRKDLPAASFLPAHSPETRAESLFQGTHLAMDRTRLAGARTNLALTRNLLASERTLMAWIRTCLAMISFGFTIGKLGDALSSTKVGLLFGRTTDIAGVAYYLVSLGTLALMVAALQYRVEVAHLIPSGSKGRPSLAFVIAVLLSLFGMFVFTDLVTRL